MAAYSARVSEAGHLTDQPINIVIAVSVHEAAHLADAVASGALVLVIVEKMSAADHPSSRARLPSPVSEAALLADASSGRAVLPSVVAEAATMDSAASGAAGPVGWLVTLPPGYPKLNHMDTVLVSAKSQESAVKLCHATWPLIPEAVWRVAVYTRMGTDPAGFSQA